MVYLVVVVLAVLGVASARSSFVRVACGAAVVYVAFASVAATGEALAALLR